MNLRDYIGKVQNYPNQGKVNRKTIANDKAKEEKATAAKSTAKK